MIPVFIIWIVAKRLLLASGGEHPVVHQICILLLDTSTPTLMSLSSDVSAVFATRI